jgi:hypothetical protein
MSLKIRFEADGEHGSYLDELNNLVRCDSFITVTPNVSYNIEECLKEYDATDKNGYLSDEFVLLKNNLHFRVLEKTSGLKNSKPRGIAQLYPTAFENILVISVYGLFQVKELRIFATYRSKHDLDLLRSSVFKAGVFSRNEKKHMFIEVRLSYVPDSLWSNTANGRSVFHFNDTFNQPLIAKQLAASNAASVDSSDFRNILRGTYLERIESECISLLKQYSLPELQRELADLKDGSISFPSKWLFTDLEPSSLFKLYYNNKDLTEVFRNNYDAILQTPPCPYLNRYLAHFFRLGFYSPFFTDTGLSLPTLTPDNEINVYPLNYEDLAAKCTFFWNTQPFEVPAFQKEIIGSNNAHIDYVELVKAVKIKDDDLDSCKGFAMRVLKEAVQLKKWTIPWGAYVKIDSHPFVGVKLHEVGKEVIALLVFSNGTYAKFIINPYDQSVIFPQRPTCFGYFENIIQEDEKQKVVIQSCRQYLSETTSNLASGVSAFLGAMIRDFWVVEERNRVFGKSVSVRSVSQMSGDRRKKVVVYLPRVKYLLDGKNIISAEAELDLVKRTEHFVVGHLRKAIRASDQQLLMARDHGICVPEGFTFVKPHKRGHIQAEKLYRSRSAMQCLRVLDFKEECGDDWFSYELNTKSWLERNGFSVDHLSGSRNGDGGADLRASKGEAIILIQCKYWRNPVGVGVVRELIGTLQDYPEGTMGLIAASSTLTQDARTYAEKHSIHFIEHLRFDQEICAKLPVKSNM